MTLWDFIAKHNHWRDVDRLAAAISCLLYWLTLLTAIVAAVAAYRYAAGG